MANLEPLDEEAPKRVLSFKPWVGWGNFGHTAEMRHGLLAFGSHFLPLVSVQQYRPPRSFLSRLVVAKSLSLTLSAIMLAPVLLTRKPKGSRLGG